MLEQSVYMETGTRRALVDLGQTGKGPLQAIACQVLHSVSLQRKTVSGAWLMNAMELEQGTATTSPFATLSDGFRWMGGSVGPDLLMVIYQC